MRRKCNEWGFHSLLLNSRLACNGGRARSGIPARPKCIPSMLQALLRVEFRFPSSESETHRLPSFGEKLKLEREKRKISLEQISSTTKIGTRMLQALEEDKFTQLPGGIFNKGFVRAYARVVGLDEEQTVADYLQASGDAPAARPELMTDENPGREAVASREAGVRDSDHRISRLEAISDEPSRPLPWGLFAVILLMIALGLSLWSHRRREQERKEAHPAPIKTAAPSTEAASQTVATAPADTPASSPSSPPSSSLLTTAPVKPPPSATGAQPNSLAGQNSNVMAAPSSGEFLVVIHAREESWISVTVDGKFSGSEVLVAGSDRTFRAQRDVSIKAGNSGALDFQLDGKTLQVGGAYGEVKSVTIGHGGVIPSPTQPPANP